MFLFFWKVICAHHLAHTKCPDLKSEQGVSLIPVETVDLNE